MDEIRSEEINWELLLSQIPCVNHMKDSFIVHRGDGVIVLRCGCAYRVTAANGIQFINTVAPETKQPGQDLTK